MRSNEGRVTPSIRTQRASDRSAVVDVVGRAFAGEQNVIALEESLEARPDSVGFVAELDGRVVGHVRLTRGWIDAEPRLVAVLVLSPLSVLPELQRRGVGRALVAHAVEHARAMRAPAVFLEGSPTYYSRLGWRPGGELGVTPPSARIPLPAFQAVRLDGWAEWMRGALVYAEPFWEHDCVGLRGEPLAAARERS
jgi:putative acetyltransferase